MNRPFVCFALLGSFLLACGVGASESQGGIGPDLSDGGTDSGPGPTPDDGGTCSTPSPFACALPCGGGYTSPSCANGSWECPNYGSPPCVEQVDSGPDAGCAGPAPVCPGYDYCAASPPICVGSTWLCLTDCLIEDAGPDVWTYPDAQPVDATPPPPPPPPLFNCGDLGCDPTTSYCEIFAGGAILEDGGARTGYACNPLPSACIPGAATCGCLQGTQGASCGCVANDGRVIETCEVP